ncbi:hypothetical protein ACW5F0_03795 [Luteimonas sp. A534]
MKIALLLVSSLLVATLAMIAPPAFAQSHSPTVYAYANAYGVSLEEAERRSAVANMARELQEKLKRELPDSFAGMYLEHVPEHRAVVLLTGDAPAQLRRFTSDEFYVPRQVSYSLELMRAVQMEIGNVLQRSSVPFYVSLDVESNELVVTVENMAKAAMELVPLRSVYDFVRLEQGDLPVPVELIGGAVVGGYDDSQEYRESTLGFNVVTSELELGIIGSGHAVNNSVEVDQQPMALEFIDEWVHGNFDVQLFVQSSLQPLPQPIEAIPDFRSLGELKSWNATRPAIGTAVITMLHTRIRKQLH